MRQALNSKNLMFIFKIKNYLLIKISLKVKQTRIPLKNSVSIKNIEKFKKMSKNTSEKETINTQSRVNIMCTSLVVTFIICWFPQHVWHLSRLRGIPISEDKVTIT